MFPSRYSMQQVHSVPCFRILCRCSMLCASGIKGRHCWNEKQMLVRNSPDCSSFSFFMPKLWVLPCSISLPPAVSLFSLCVHHLLQLWHTLFLKVMVNQHGDSLHQSAWCTPQSSWSFLCLHSSVLLELSSCWSLTLLTLLCQWKKDRERERWGCDRS